MKLSLKGIGINAALALLFGGLAASLTGGSFALIAGITFALGFIPKGQDKGIAQMGLLTEVWVADIKEELFFENEFLMLAEDHSSYIGNKVVHIPQSGTNPKVVKNRTELVADLQVRTDDEITYEIDNFTTDPFLVKDVEELNISYSKRQSVMGQHMATLRDSIAENTLLSWATEGKVPKQGRYAIVPTAMYYDLFTNAELIANRARLGQDEVKMGVVGDIHGFKIIYRGTVTRYTGAAANVLIKPAADGTTPTATTDCAGGLFFSKFAVSQALGEIKMYYNEGEARSYGDILSAEVNHGAHFCRKANWGRVGIAQATA